MIKGTYCQLASDNLLASSDAALVVQTAARTPSQNLLHTPHHGTPHARVEYAITKNSPLVARLACTMANPGEPLVDTVRFRNTCATTTASTESATPDAILRRGRRGQPKQSSQLDLT